LVGGGYLVKRRRINRAPPRAAPANGSDKFSVVRQPFFARDAHRLRAKNTARGFQDVNADAKMNFIQCTGVSEVQTKVKSVTNFVTLHAH
jgi:hypothetical protein